MKMLLMLSLLATLAFPQTASAAEVTNEHFRLTLPEGYGAFAKQVQTAKSPEGDIETTNWVSKAPTGEALVVTMSEMPGKILDPEKLFASTRDSLLKSLGAELENEEKREDVLPSSRLMFKSNAAFFRSRFVVDDNRFYQLLYVGRAPETRIAAPVSQIFDSFEIKTPAPAPAEATPAASAPEAPATTSTTPAPAGQ